MQPWIPLGALVVILGVAARPVPAPALTIEEFGSDSTAFDVTATLVARPTEAILWDAQYHVSDARKMVDRIAATGKKLKAIVISHPDHDHYMGAAVVVARFPGTPVYLTAAALEEYQKTSAQALGNERPLANGPSALNP